MRLWADPFFPFIPRPETLPGLAPAGKLLVRGSACTDAIRTHVKVRTDIPVISLFVTVSVNTRAPKTGYTMPRPMRQKSGGGGTHGKRRTSVWRRTKMPGSSCSMLIHIRAGRKRWHSLSATTGNCRRLEPRILAGVASTISSSIRTFPSRTLPESWDRVWTSGPTAGQ
jgi:hypothetical protein